MVKSLKEMIIPSSFNNSSNGISNSQLRQNILRYIFFIDYIYLKIYIFPYRVLLVQLMELLSMHIDQQVPY